MRCDDEDQGVDENERGETSAELSQVVAQLRARNAYGALSVI